jgi:hypothetical protein
MKYQAYLNRKAMRDPKVREDMMEEMDIMELRDPKAIKVLKEIKVIIVLYIYQFRFWVFFYALQ